MHFPYPQLWLIIGLVEHSAPAIGHIRHDHLLTSEERKTPVICSRNPVDHQHFRHFQSYSFHGAVALPGFRSKCYYSSNRALVCRQNSHDIDISMPLVQRDGCCRTQCWFTCRYWYADLSPPSWENSDRRWTVRNHKPFENCTQLRHDRPSKQQLALLMNLFHSSELTA